MRRHRWSCRNGLQAFAFAHSIHGDDVNCQSAAPARTRLDQVKALEVAEEAIEQIALLCGVETDARSKPPEERVHLHQKGAEPVFHDLEAQLRRIPGKSELATAIRYARGRVADHPVNRADELLPWSPKLMGGRE